MPTIYLSQTGQGLPILLLHGWGFDHKIWSSILPSLNKHYTIYRVDLPGFGETPCMPWEDFKHTLMQQLPKKFAVLGWSLGGLIATRLALEAPEEISHLINIASSPCLVASNHWPGIQPDALNLFSKNLKLNPEKTHQEFIQLQLPSHIKHKPSPPQNTQGLIAGLDILKNWDFRKNLHTLKPPTAYLFGQLDRIVPAKTLSIMEATYPDFDYKLIRKTGHTPFLTHPKVCLEWIHQLIQRT
jgi:pimeloyl-[acyl-carrier protein] methyl ester esterase